MNEKGEQKDFEIIPLTHPPMYLMHKYWARKPYNIVASYISRYCPPEGIVLDPFMGSGVSIIEAVFNGRKAVGIDINPVSLMITRNTGKYVNIANLELCFQKITSDILKKDSIFYQLYRVDCPDCNNCGIITHLIWNENVLVEIRINCEKCGNLVFKPINADVKSLELEKYIKRQEENSIMLLKKLGLEAENFNFQYSSKVNFIQLRHDLRKKPQSSELFSKRNLSFLTYLNHQISLIPDQYEEEKKMLKFCFTSALGQASKMVWVIDKRNGKKIKKKQVGSWTHHFFWNPSNYFEVNAWNCFKSRYKKLIKGKLNSNARQESKDMLKFSEASKFETLSLNNPVLLLNQSAESLNIPDNSIDFVFTDPPYGDSIQYGELSSLWASWLGYDMKKYLNRIESEEIIINSKQNKKINYYEDKLKKVFNEIYRVLKQNSYMVLTFHNTSFKIRNILLLSVTSSGFELKQILFQLPPRVSIKSMLHHSGSPIGDYYIRFQKTHSMKMGVKKQKIPLTLVEKQKKIIEVIDKILAQRGEPTSFLWISNFIDEFLFKMGLFPLEDFEELISQIKTSKYYRIDEKGKWWFTKIKQSQNLNQPLTKRIESYLKSLDLLNILSKTKKTKKQEIFNIIYKKFRGIDTPDKFLINTIIESIKK
jgi:16S rRNA G966 N2-methylase RsmD